MTGWVQHIPSGDPAWHSVSAVIYGGSLLTRCRGRWSETDPILSHDNPPRHERCGACVKALADMTNGLREAVEEMRNAR